MCEKFPDEDQIASNAVMLSSDIYSASDAKRFLEIEILDKPNNVRMICWLIGLGLIPGDRMQWMPAILKLQSDYKACIHRYVEDSYDTPLDTVVSKPVLEVKDRISYSFAQFMQMASDFGIPTSKLDNCEKRIQRIFAIIFHERPNFSFSPGFEYICFVSLLISFSFTTMGSLPPIFAEAIGFHIASALLSISTFNSKMESMKLMEEHKERLLSMIKDYSSATLSKLHAAGDSFSAISSNWEILLFTDLHRGDNLLLILDNIILHRKDFRLFMNYLSVAHFRQIERKGGDVTVGGFAMDGKWDIPALFSDIEALQESEKNSDWGSKMSIFCPCFNIAQLFGWVSK